MSESKRVLRPLTGTCGESRKPSHIVTLTAEVSAVVQWPDGVPFDANECKQIVATGVRSRHDRDVGRPGEIVWAQCSLDVREEDVVINEVDEIS